MLTRLEIKMEPCQELRVNASSLLQGVLMEQIDSDYAEYLHSLEMNPYTQHLEWREGEPVWILTTVTEEAENQILQPLLSADFKRIYVKHKDMELAVREKAVKQVMYRDLLQQTYFGSCGRTLEIEFVTPTAFKTGGRYQFYPTITHIFQSLARKHDGVRTDTEIFSEELMQEVDEKLEVTGYRLRSTRFHLEGVKIPAFLGTLRIRIHGPQQFVNLIHFLLQFGTYSGVGIKSSIGMGAIRVVEVQRRKETEIER